MRFLSCALILLLFSGCWSAGKTKTHGSFDQQVLARHTNSNKGLIISCYRCSCIDEFMSVFARQGVQIQVFADSTCFKGKPARLSHLDQLVIDSLYEENYNAILFRKKGGGYEFKILRTEDADNFAGIGEEFFR